MNAKINKYRPYLSFDEIICIMNKLDRTDAIEGPIYANLALVKFKAENGISDGSYRTNPRKTLEEKLELNDDEQEDIMAQIAAGIGKIAP